MIRHIECAGDIDGTFHLSGATLQAFGALI